MMVAGMVVGRPGVATPPFPSRTLWTIAGDGRVAIAHPDPYRVDYILSSGAKVRGPPISYESVVVDERVKQEWRDRKGAPGPVTTVTPSGRRATAMQRRRVQEPSTWPDHLPPFLDGKVLFDRVGRLWIKRATAPSAEQLYDVVDVQGRLVERVYFPRRTDVIGFTDRAVLVAQTDDDDVQRVAAYTVSR